jgi:MFS family permease
MENTLTIPAKVTIILAFALYSFEATIVYNTAQYIVQQIESSSSSSSSPLFAWFLSSYVLGGCAGGLIFSQVSNIFGCRKVFIVNTILFTLTTLVIGFMDNLLAIILLRGLQGATGLGMLTLSVIIMDEHVPISLRGQFLWLFMVPSFLVSAIAPILGSWIVVTFGWPWIFWIMIPFAIALFVILTLWYQDAATVVRNTSVYVYVDWVGISSSLIATIALIVLISRPTREWPLVFQLLIASLFIIMICIFIWRETHYSSPILRVGLFLSNRVFAVTMISGIIGGVSMFSILPFIALALQKELSVSIYNTAIILLFDNISIVVFILICGKFIFKYKKIPRYGSIATTFATVITGILLCYSTAAADSIAILVVFSIFMYALVATTTPMLNILVKSHLATEDQPMVSGALIFFRNLGGALGLIFFDILQTLFLDQGNSALTAFGLTLLVLSVMFLLNTILLHCINY